MSDRFPSLKSFAWALGSSVLPCDMCPHARGWLCTCAPCTCARACAPHARVSAARTLPRALRAHARSPRAHARTPCPVRRARMQIRAYFSKTSPYLCTCPVRVRGARVGARGCESVCVCVCVCAVRLLDVGLCRQQTDSEILKL